MLYVYSATWCPHCQKAITWLKNQKVPFEVIDIEKTDEETVKKVVAANGGEDWVVPTLEFNGQWREGKVFEAASFREDLIRMGVEIPGNA
ncbi:glutaredoxin family protein [Desulfobotulus mexicanus]|uniref:Glutaredoxin family protein n=1 Tax=Desulfobotulus mexicanus TaxID=2586642 RepID=A0A5Q4VBI9_9BACT|nr:glutaredoxin family protein [Desulfobotulus mexicanus]TYT75094.1 glutaredoxin family protein [Desulfobotulus mexicanus]